MNLYGYGFGNPVNGTDRSGLILDQCYEDPECRIRLIAPGPDGGQGSNPGGPGVSFFAGGPAAVAGGAGGGLVVWLFDKIFGFFGSHSNNAPRDPSVPPSTAYVRGKPIDPYSDYEDPGVDSLVPLVPTAGAPTIGVQPPPPPPPPGGGGGGGGRMHPAPTSGLVEFRYYGSQWPPWGLEVTDPALEASLSDPDNWAFGEIPIGGGRTLIGFTRHGLNQVISRNAGRGVSAKAVLDALKNPLRIAPQARGAFKYVGDNASAIISETGRFMTAYGRPRRPF